MNLTSNPNLALTQILNHHNPFPTLGFPQVAFDGFVAALVALSLNEGAYMSEIVRAGIDSIDVGQMEAAKSLGMTYFLAMRRIVLPQAARVIIPPLGNEFDSMLKNTSLAVTISVGELFGAAYALQGVLGRPMELYTVAAFWYLVLTLIWTAVQSLVERRLNVSVYDNGPSDRGSYWQRVFGFGRRPVATSGTAGVVAIPDNRRSSGEETRLTQYPNPEDPYETRRPVFLRFHPLTAPWSTLARCTRLSATPRCSKVSHCRCSAARSS